VRASFRDIGVGDVCSTVEEVRMRAESIDTNDQHADFSGGCLFSDHSGQIVIRSPSDGDMDLIVLLD
jgi:hypothetical protein